MKLNPIILAAVTVLAGHANAAVVASANFTGLSGTNVATLATSGTPGVNEFAWSMIGPASTDRMSIVNANITTGSGNALQLNDSTNTGFRGILGTMSSSTTIDIGETLTLSFSGKYLGSTNNSGGLRFGFVNSGDLDNAYATRVGTGGNTSMDLIRDTGGDDSPAAGTVLAVTGGITGPSPAYVGITTSTFEGIYSITRTASTTYSLTASMNGSTISATDVADQGWDNYNRIFIRNGGINNGFQVDDVSVTLIPEPSAAFLGGLGLLTLLRRRR